MFKSSWKKIKEEIVQFESQIESSEKMIRQAGEAIKQLVDIQVDECLLELASLKSENAKQAEIVQERLQLALIAMESFHKYSRELLDKNRPSDITRAANKLHKRARELLDSDVSSVQYCPPQIAITASPLRETHMLFGISVACHPAEVRIPPLPSTEAGT